MLYFRLQSEFDKNNWLFANINILKIISKAPTGKNNFQSAKFQSTNRHRGELAIYADDKRRAELKCSADDKRRAELECFANNNCRAELECSAEVASYVRVWNRKTASQPANYKGCAEKMIRWGIQETNMGTPEQNLRENTKNSPFQSRMANSIHTRRSNIYKHSIRFL